MPSPRVLSKGDSPTDQSLPDAVEDSSHVVSLSTGINRAIPFQWGSTSTSTRQILQRRVDPRDGKSILPPTIPPDALADRAFPDSQFVTRIDGTTIILPAAYIRREGTGVYPQFQLRAICTTLESRDRWYARCEFADGTSSACLAVSGVRVFQEEGGGTVMEMDGVVEGRLVFLGKEAFRGAVQDGNVYCLNGSRVGGLTMRNVDIFGFSSVIQGGVERSLREGLAGEEVRGVAYLFVEYEVEPWMRDCAKMTFKLLGIVKDG